MVSVDRGRYGCLAGDRMVTAMKARELGRRSVAVGDRVLLAGDVSGAPDTLARIVRIAARTSVLRRTADDADPVERVMVANADQLVIVTALADPAPTRFIDRCLVAAYDAGIEPLLCLTKADLAPPDEVLERLRAAGVAAHVTQRPLSRGPAGRAAARSLDGQISVMIGHSGVGKSTLVNALVPDADRAAGVVNAVTGRAGTRRRRRSRCRCRAAAG